MIAVQYTPVEFWSIQVNFGQPVVYRVYLITEIVIKLNPKPLGLVVHSKHLNVDLHQN